MLHTMQALILAAGKSKRFKTNKTKLTETVCGQPLVLYQTKLLEELSIPTSIVIGHHRDSLEKVIKEAHGDRINFIEQKDPKGTGDAVRCTRSMWEKDNVLVMNGDVPLISAAIIKELFTTHIASGAMISLVVSHDNNTLNSYGRVMRNNGVVTIIEAKDLTSDMQESCCVNAGIYIFNRQFLERHIDEIPYNKLSSEYYLTDLINIAGAKHLSVNTVSAPFDQVRGINTLEELWAAEQIKRSELIKYWMHNGVRFSIAQNVQIDIYVRIGAGTFIGSGVQLTGTTTVGENCHIGAFSLLNNATLENEVTVEPHSVIRDSTIGISAVVGPFAYVREHSKIGAHSIIGAFVETKHSVIGEYTKAKHLSYLGDATIGNRVNIGGGTIVANHNGVQKNKTVIKESAYIGANNSLVAPVTVGKNAYTAAGSTITQDVPADALAIARARQVNKANYASLLKDKDFSIPHKKKECNRKHKNCKHKKESAYVGAVQLTPPVSSQES
jgi:bifunctional UDP-N-acetylglucosamine pyrophosphorylase / glucosamine-1-phosphate N-acetyltransferase